MRREVGSAQPLRPTVYIFPTLVLGDNPGMWVQIGGEHQNPIIMLMETIQKLRT